MQVFLDLLDHLVNELSKKLSVQTIEQGARHLKPLLAIVITIVLRGSTQSTSQKPVDHVSDKVGFLKIAVSICRDMRQDITLKEVNRVPDSRISVELVIIAAFSRNIVQSILSCANSLRLFERCSQHINHIRVILIIDHQVLDRLVRDDIKGSEQDGNGYVLSDDWNTR